MLLVLVFTLFSAALVATSLLRLNNDSNELKSQSRAAAIKAVSETVRLIEQQVESLKLAKQLARELEHGELNSENLDARIQHEISLGNDIAITVGWLPGHFPASSQPQADTAIIFKLGFESGEQVGGSYYSYTKDQVANRQLGDITNWYSVPVREQRPVWFGSVYYSPASKTWWAGGYSVPFIIDGEVAGVVAAELTLEQANKAVFEAEDAGFRGTPIDSNFGILVSSSGTMFSHPNLNVVRQRRNISDFIPAISTPEDIRTLFERAETDADTEIYILSDFERERTGQTLSIFFAPINETGWWAVLVLDQMAINRSEDNTSKLKSASTTLFMSLLAFVFGLSLLLLRVDRGSETRLWMASLIFSMLSAAGIAGLLYYSVNHSGHTNVGEVRLQNLAITSKAIIRHQGEKDQTPVTIPTGIFIQSAEFSSANDVTVTGFIWQKYNNDLPGWLQRGANDTDPGFILPEAEQVEIEFRYRRPVADGWVYGWYFSAVLRQEFDYTKYPFDQENAWVRLWHSDIGRGVILTPDFISYDTLVPAALPGLELQDFVLEGWDVAATYFSYRHNDYMTNFGIETNLGSDNFERRRTVPELYFNMAMKRQFLNAFIMNFITITVVAFLLFAVLYTIRTDKVNTDLLGFNVSAVLGFCAALFFVVILAHTSLRESLSAQSLVYLEYYFFVMYAAFLGVSVNAIIAASDIKHPILRFGDNLAARLVYWPLLSFSLLVVTLVIF
jgi:hypothetical protein